MLCPLFASDSNMLNRFLSVQMGLNVISAKRNLKTMQVSNHLTWVAWVGHVSLAGARYSLSAIGQPFA